MRKQIGDKNKKAREAASATLVRLKGQDIESLKSEDQTALLLALLQLFGLADQSGKII